MVLGPRKIANSQSRYECSFESASEFQGNRESNFVVAVDQIRDAREIASSLKYRFAKRAVDLGLAGVMLSVAAPVLLGVAAAVWMTSPGPVLYREKRVGRHGKRFVIYKFRSMYTPDHLRAQRGYRECEAIQMRRRQDDKHRGDPRVTPLGKHLRRLSLDELPQLFNVLRGDMSCIGPRPVIEAELDRYGANAYFYKLAVPGLTGLWQVSGRNDVSYDQRVKFDVEYCSTWSLRLDARILLRTIPTVLKGRGAY